MAETKRIPEHAAIRIRDRLAARLDADFGPRGLDGRRRVGQRQICDRIGISQPVLKDIENAAGGLGVHALVALRNYLRVPIDELLELEPLQTASATPPSFHDEIRAAVRAELESIRNARHETPELPKGPPDAPSPRHLRRR